MPSSTPNLALPYPLAADPANVPSDILALATRIDNLAGSGVFSKAPTRQAFFSGSGTYTTPAGCRAILVECMGGGGGGGGGGYSSALIANPVASYSYQVGQGCAGGAAGNNPGATPTAANDTIFGASLVVANAGSPGQGMASSTTAATCAGGVGGVGISGTGDVRLDGGDGGAALISAPSIGVAGYGGAGAMYGQSRAGSPSLATGGGTGYRGSGGAGGIRTSASGSHAGGAGGWGIIVVTEFY